jgi:DNA-binding MarR family transcriptional regulator
MDTGKIRDFRRSLRQFTRVITTQLRDCCTEVTLAQCLVLLEVEDRERLTVGQLASRLRLDDSTLSRTIDGLVRRGLLERTRDDRDRRVVWICLTEEGARACAAIHRQNDALYRSILGRIPPSRRAAVVRNFKVLVPAFLDRESESVTPTACATTEREVSP